MKRGFTLGLLLFTFLTAGLSGDLLLDEPPLKRGEILLFKDHENPNNFYYLCSKIRVALDSDHRPKISFFKLKEGEAVLSFFLTHGLSSEELSRIRKDLAGESQGILLKGPVSFSEGKFYVFNRTNGDSELWATGRAPLFPNQEVVVSRKLKEPFELDTVAVFVMEYEGITKKINARLSVNWDQVYVQEDMSVKTEWTSIEIKNRLRRLTESGAIRLEVAEDHGALTRVWDVAYEHLIHQMFDVQEIMMGESTSSKIESGIGTQGIVYTLKEEKKSGSYLVDFNRRFKDRRQIVLAADIGEALQRAIDR